MQIRVLFLQFLILSNIYALELKQSYSFTSNMIYLDTFIQTKNHQLILTIPKHISKYKISSQKLIKLLSLYNIEATSKYNKISFTKAINYDYNIISDSIRKQFIDYYPSIKISNITIEPISFLDLTDYKIKSIDFKKHYLKSNKGTFRVLFINKSRKKKLYFKYKLDATIMVLKSTQDIKTKSKIGIYNTSYTRELFKKLYYKPLDINLLDKIIATKFIRRNITINSSFTKKIPLVFKNSSLVVTFYESNFEINFEAIALSDGGLNDVIYVKKRDGTKYRVIITGKKKAIID